MAYVNWLLHCSTPISDFVLICRRLSSHTHGRLVNGEILIYRRRAAPFKFEASLVQQSGCEFSFQGRAYGEYADAGVDKRMVRRHERGSLVPVVEPLSSGDSAEHKQGTVLG